MKIAGRGGHNPLCPGASALLDEVIEDRKIFTASKKYLSTKHEFIDCTPSPVSGQNNDLSFGVKKANSSGAKYFYSVHLNKAYTKYEGAIGSEVWLYSANSELKAAAERILKNLEALGFKNRGIKYKTSLYELRNTDMPAMIVECFFLEATKDVEIYNRIGADLIGFAIANGIDPNIEKEVPKPVEAPVSDSKQYGIVTASTLNVRKGRGTNFAVIGSLKNGQKVRLDKLIGDWYSIYFGDHGGFVHKNYIKPV